MRRAKRKEAQRMTLDEKMIADVEAEINRLSPLVMEWLQSGPTEVSSVTAMMILTGRSMAAFIIGHDDEENRQLALDRGVELIASQAHEVIDRIDAMGLTGPFGQGG
jgi:hypothetical protein